MELSVVECVIDFFLLLFCLFCFVGVEVGVMVNGDV